MRRRAQGDLPPGHALLCLLLLALGALSLPSCSSSPAQDHPPEVEASQAQSSPEPKPDSTARFVHVLPIVPFVLLGSSTWTGGVGEDGERAFN